MSAAIGFKFDNTFVHNLAGLYLPWHASTVPSPELLILNEQLVLELGLDAAALRQDHGISILAGNEVPEGASPCAQAYAGHQFGQFTKLGDGRALLLGEIIDSFGNRKDLHFKGSGKTPYARRGDGKATVGPMLREYLMGEAMYALGIPTTRILSVVETGEKVRREIELPGAILCRVAASHIRVGTFEYAATSRRLLAAHKFLPPITSPIQDLELIKRLADYTIDRHYPQCKNSLNPYLSFLEEVCETQARLVASWMSIGFIHGVLNTDNVTISGETIDYGPCAFLDEYDPSTVFSSIDTGGRYAYGAQPSITEWNLQQLACCLTELINDTNNANKANNVIMSYKQRYQKYWLAQMCSKLGIIGGSNSGIKNLINDFLKLMEKSRADFTLCFRYLSNVLRGDSDKFCKLFKEDYQESLNAWINRWLLLLNCSEDKFKIANQMDQTNPIYIPRNFHVENALTEAVGGDMQPFLELLEVLKHPFTEKPGFEKYAHPGDTPGSTGNVCHKTFCGT